MKMTLFASLAFLIISIFGGFIILNLYPSKPSIPVNDLPIDLQNWFSGGMYKTVTVSESYKMFYKIFNYTGTTVTSPPTLIFIHGFPTSSYDYHKVLKMGNELTNHFQVLVFDHLGFGFSNKPQSNFSYSIIEHADYALALWQSLDIRRAHILAHDMGDSVLTEILTRYNAGLLPDYFKLFFDSVIFTNGGMMVEHISFRLSQRILLNDYLGPALSSLAVKISPAADWFARKQIASIWSPLANQNEMRVDIDAIIALNQFGHGQALMHKTIRYLSDRFLFESRWLTSLARSGPPCFFVWGDSDAVSPPKLFHALRHTVPRCRATLIPGLGHFGMLEDPERWTKIILGFLIPPNKSSLNGD